MQVLLKYEKKTGTVHEDGCTRTFMTISRSILFRKRKVSDNSCTENSKTHILYSRTVFRKSCRLWDKVENLVEHDRPQVTIYRMLFSWWKPKATDTHSDSVIFFFLSTATMVAWSLLKAICTLHCLVFLLCLPDKFRVRSFDVYKQCK